MKASLDGRAALVTGGSRGIGLGIAREVLACGGSVCITARKQHELDAALDDLGAGERAIAAQGSTDDPDHRAAAIARCVEAFGSVDILVNNAATNAQFGPLVDGELPAVRRTIEANLVAPLGWVQEAWRAWMAEHGGSVLNIASVGGLRAGRFAGAYNVSKAGLIHLTRQLALELAPGVRVNCLALGLIRTHFSRALLEHGEDEIVAQHPLGRLGLAEDVAAAAAYFLSDQAAWVTGQVLVVDGGGTSLGGVTETVTSNLPFARARP